MNLRNLPPGNNPIEIALPSPLQIVALASLLAAVAMSADEWRRVDNRECRRLTLAFAASLLLRLLLLIALPAGAPSLAPFVEVCSLILVLWAFARAAFDNPSLADQLFASLFGLAGLAEVATWGVWLAGRPALPWSSYDAHWSTLLWRLFQVGLAGSGLWLILERRHEQRVLLAPALALSIAAGAAILFGHAAWTPFLEAGFYLLLAVAAYQMITSDLRSYGQELRALSEKSLHYLREQALLMEISRAAAESLEQSHIMQVIADQSGLVFDADRLALLLNEEDEAGRLRVAARYHALRDDYAESLQSHIHLRDAPLFRTVVRRKRQLALSRAGVAGASHDLADVERLLGMESLGHAMIEPLLFKEEVIGLLLAARRQGRPAFSAEEGRLFTSMGALLTSTLQNARLYQTLKQANQELARLNQDLRQAFAQLQSVDQLKSSFIGVITHELRSPFVDLEFSLQLLRRYGLEQLSAEQREQLAQVEQGVGRARRMVDSLVSFAGLLSRQGALNVSAVNFSELVSQATAGLATLAQNRSVQIEVQAGGEEPLWVEGDRARLAEAVHHLIHNAVKFNRAGGRVDIRYWTDESHLSFEVEDSGVGLSPARLETIWQPFTQAADPLRRGVEGLGLGLALVKLIIEAHGGRVAAQSVEGVGSSFGFQIPLQARPTAPGSTK